MIRGVGLRNYSCRRIVGQQESLEAQTVICRDAIRYLVSRERLEMPTVSIRSFRMRVSTPDRTASNSLLLNSRARVWGHPTVTESFEKGNGMMKPSQLFIRKHRENLACIGTMGVAVS